MSAFILVAAVMAIAAVAVLVWPLLRTASGPGEGQGAHAHLAATAVAAFFPLAAFATYFWASNWSWDPARQAAPAGSPSIEQMVVQLESRLARQPEDVEGWKLLGRSATVLGDFAKAREAFGEAYTRTQGQDAQAVVGYAESLVLADEREIDGQAAQLFERGLQLDPDNARALWYGGIVAFRRGDLAVAQQRWVELQNHELPPDLRQVIAERLAEIGRAGVEPAATAGDTGDTTAVIRLSIDVAEPLRSAIRPGATLFVIARRDGGGPPLAVVRRAVGAWPLAVTMSDADTMLPGGTLAGSGPLAIVARVSQQGGPVASSGDLEGEVGYDSGSAGPVSVTIDRIVP